MNNPLCIVCAKPATTERVGSICLPSGPLPDGMHFFCTLHARTCVVPGKTVSCLRCDEKYTMHDQFNHPDTCTGKAAKPDAVNHPAHYGGKDNPYETIKVIEAWELGFNIGNTVKYLSRAGKKGNRLEDLKKAAFYLNREIENEEKK